MKCSEVLVIVGVLACVVGGISGARILALMTVPSRSHHLWNSKYLEGLAARGHHITYAGVDEYKNPPKNIRHIFIEGVYEATYADIDMNTIGQLGAFETMHILNVWDEITAQAIVKAKGFQVLLNILKTEKFDLIVDDVGFTMFLLGASAPLGYPPIIGITAFGVPPWVLEMSGNPVSYSGAPHAFLHYTNKMCFTERIHNYMLYLYSYYERYWLIVNQERFIKQAFGSNTKPVTEIINDMNIFMVNSHPAIDYPTATLPGLIDIAGMHIMPPKPLPKDLQQLLDNAKDGAIYFSLGSNVQSSELQGRTIDIFKEAFKRLAPIKVLWKWEADELSGKPDNVEVRKWLPQNDILAHPNVRVFFTHSGLLSTQEAAYHGVPIVGMPFFLDQHVNIKKCVRKGVGEQLDLQTLTSEKVYSTLKKVLDNPQYRDNMRNLSAIFKDNMNSPLERAIYWTEYAIRHKGAPHLRPGTRDLAWYQNWLLDVLFVVVVCPLLLLCLVIHLVRKLLTAVFTTRKIKKH